MTFPDKALYQAAPKESHTLMNGNYSLGILDMHLPFELQSKVNILTETPKRESPAITGYIAH